MTRADSPAQVRFRSCVLDLHSHRLYRDGELVHLTPKAFELLATLVAHAPRALTKAELLKTLWPDSFVSDDALARLISDLRGAIGDSAKEPKLIRTIHGFGYAFDGEVNGAAGGLAVASPFFVTWATHEFRLTARENVIGRDPDVAVPINAPVVSRRHAQIVIENGAAYLEDLGSKNGTFVGDERVTARRRLDDGDVIKIGDHELTFWRAVQEFPTLTRQE